MKMEQICESPVRSKPRSLIVVVTEGCAPVQCYSIGDTQLKTVSVPVPSLDTSRIKVGPAKLFSHTHCTASSVNNSSENCRCRILQFCRLALKSPPLGRWAKKLGCASNPPVCSLLVWEDRMPTYPTWALVGGTSRAAGETVYLPFS